MDPLTAVTLWLLLLALGGSWLLFLGLLCWAIIQLARELGGQLENEGASTILVESDRGKPSQND